ncbi:unnamed protein product [Triticum turgidum subsp. durum]|uniref:Bifunctional inhibitor/plant lipid transfer protein/seed storage helical domain-containing protein n=1 Tax=Triticum turgidum subsp. durum TaxID=4567 RepID=A0A9R0XQS6_TRITD|nr:unnamed protein product [Triticum turgidum subsp. durum]
MASSHILLLAAILLALASAQASGQSMPPSPATAARGGNCTLNGAVTLGVCLKLQQGRTSTADENQCCHRIQGMQTDCLCLAFHLGSGLIGGIPDGVNSVLGVCGMARIPNLVCLVASGTV